MLTTSAYLLGKTRFYGLDLRVNKDVLVPRYETEVLVDEVLSCINSGDHRSPLRILDLCTGSGAIAIAIGKTGGRLPPLHIVAADISKEALTVARANALLHGVDIEFIHSNMFENVSGKFDTIVSNPPYVRTADIGVEDPQTLKEPRMALDGGTDGLDFYRIIAERAGEYLTSGGMLFLEIGYDQGDDVSELLRSHKWSNIEVIKDKGGRNRVVKACWKN